MLETASSIEKIAEAAHGAAAYLSFYDTNSHSEIYQNQVQHLIITDVRIVALGEHECTIAFDGEIHVSHHVEWFVPSGPDGEMEQTGETVTREYDVSGTAKVSLDAKTNALLDIPYVALNEEEIEATDLPPYSSRWK